MATAMAEESMPAESADAEVNDETAQRAHDRIGGPPRVAGPPTQQCDARGRSGPHI